MKVRDVFKDDDGVRIQVTIDHEGMYVTFNLEGNKPRMVGRGRLHSSVLDERVWIPKAVFSQMIKMAWGIKKQRDKKAKIEALQLKFTGILDPS